MHRVLFHAHFRYFGLIACCLNRGKTATQARSRKRIEQWILDEEKKRSKEFSSRLQLVDKLFIFEFILDILPHNLCAYYLITCDGGIKTHALKFGIDFFVT